MNQSLRRTLIGGLTFLFSGCLAIKNSQYEEFLSQKLEVPECVKNYNYTPSIAITGTAKFFKRGIDISVDAGQIKNMNLGDPLATALPIRYAEIAVYNAKNQIVQCGLTDEGGSLRGLDGLSDLRIPATGGAFKIKVLARIRQTLASPVASPTKPIFNIYAAVKQDIYTNEVHSISKTVSSNARDDISADLVAYARQTDSLSVEGGAFNILNSVLTAYDYVRNNTGAVDTTCLNSKLNIYWKLGFNPFQYAYPTGDASYIANGSYYSKSEENLYITGGRLGDISIDVTNHFDDYVIIHELAHHIENKCGQLLTPGGNHYFIARIDPRLAWSEGWANYFAAQVMKNSMSLLNPEIGSKLTGSGLSADWKYLFASKGFSDSYQNVGNGTGFMFDLTRPGNNPNTWQYGPYIGSAFDRVDPTRYPGEGHFREGAITRGLFKLTNACGTYCTTSTPVTFENIWKGMDKITGAGQSSYAFRSSHDVLEKVKSFVGGGTWNSQFLIFNQAQTTEALHLFSDGAFTSGGINRWLPYGTPLTTQTGGACGVGQLYIEPRTDDPVLTATNSDQRYSNHFYTIDLNTLSGLDEISVSFNKQNSSGTTTEFDLLLFQQDYFFNGDYICATQNSSGTCTGYTFSRTGSADVLRSDRRSGAIMTKKIQSLQSLDHSKKYLLNIRAYTANRSIASVTDYSYNLTNQAGLNICP